MLDIRFATKSGNRASPRPAETGFSLQMEIQLWARALFNPEDWERGSYPNGAHFTDEKAMAQRE